MRRWRSPAPVCRGANNCMRRALQAAASFIPGFLLLSLETSSYELALTILLSGNNRDNLPHLPNSQITKMIFPLSVRLPAAAAAGGGPCPSHRVRDLALLAKSRVLFLLQHSQGSSGVKPDRLSRHCTGKGRSVFLPVARHEYICNTSQKTTPWMVLKITPTAKPGAKVL